MQIPVLVEPVAGNGFRASGGAPFGITAEGSTPEDALARFKANLAAKLHEGAAVASVEIHPDEHPWSESAGIFDPSDPIIVQWLKQISKNRDRTGVAE